MAVATATTMPPTPITTQLTHGITEREREREVKDLQEL